jgi:hypothetical protein
MLDDVDHLLKWAVGGWEELTEVERESVVRVVVARCRVITRSVQT